MTKNRIVVTGGSGFIGTNLVDYFLSIGWSVINIDINEPMLTAHKNSWVELDIVLDRDKIFKVLDDFKPRFLVHLAARTDLHEKNNLNGYSANTIGVRNIVEICNEIDSVERALFASTKLVFQNGTTSDPDTLYGISKKIGEEVLTNSNRLSFQWAIVRPTSIWGPWSIADHIPYGRFFQMIIKGHYFHPDGFDNNKLFGYVENTLYQLHSLLEADAELVDREVFYLSDYESFTIKDWAEEISLLSNGHKVFVLPRWLVLFAAKLGDMAKLLGIDEPPISTFRLTNMATDTTDIPLDNMKRVAPSLPFDRKSGVKNTIAWLGKHGYL